MNILTYSSLYPNAVDPTHGIFVERRLRNLCSSTDVSASVVAPVPWFPFKSSLWGRYGELAAVPRQDLRHHISIQYPRFPVIPKVGMRLAPGSMALATRSSVESTAESMTKTVLIDAHYFYPDGVAAGKIAQKMGIPFIVTARGSDINLIAQLPGPRKMILEAAHAASAIIAVSNALAEEMDRIGIPAAKIHVLRNGVDLELFRPGNHEQARQALGFEEPTFLTVGALKEAKGHDLAIETLHHINGARLIIIGHGEFERDLKALVEAHQLADRVSFTGRIDEEELIRYYQAADGLFLLSRREGMPNVVLESIACGTPVIAMNVGGIGEILDDPIAGELIQHRNAAAVSSGWKALQQRGIDRRRIRSVAERFSWDHTIAALHQLMVETSCRRAH